MNLIELSNDLKDVPDQLLLKEVQSPSGAYPAYLVISEMTRRKRMRESAAKQAPDTTVAEDLAQPSREQMMQAMAQLQQQPQGEPTEAQQMSLPPQGLNAMQAPAMAGGGLVAFKHGGDVDHYEKGGETSSPLGRWWSQLRDSPASDEYLRRQELLAKQRDIASRLNDLGGFFGLRQQTPQEQAEYDQLQKERDEIAGQLQSGRIVPQPNKERQEALEQGRRYEDYFRDARNQPKEKQRGGKQSAGMGSGAVSSGKVANAPAPLSDEQKKINELAEGILAFKDLSPEERAAAQARGEASYQEKMPFRLGFLEEALREREGEIKGAKDTALNNMLMQTGAAIMKSRSPHFLHALGEGSEAGLAAYQQGVKDLRASKDALMQSKVALANAQSLYDQGKFAAGEKERDLAVALNDRSLQLASSKFAVYKGIQDDRRAERVMQLEERMFPTKEAYMKALANQANAMSAFRQSMPTKLSAEAEKRISQAALMAAMNSGHAPGTPEYNAVYERALHDAYLREPGVNRPAGTGGVSAPGAVGGGNVTYSWDSVGAKK